MKENTRAAFEDLKSLGVSVYEWGEAEGYCSETVFVFVWADDMTIEVFFDDTGKYIREEYQNGRYQNPWGYRQDVHEILAKYKLKTESYGNGQIAVYDDPEASGFDHAREAELNRIGGRQNYR